MTNAKNTKRALVSNLLALVLCVSMLIGSTYAWFTDTATTGVNTIQSGTLDIDIVDVDGKSLSGDTLEFVKAADAGDEAILWEPGCTYYLEGFKIVNKGNLDAKCKVVINGLTGNSLLLEAIDFYLSTDTVWDKETDTQLSSTSSVLGNDIPVKAGETTDTYYIIGHMKEEAGNEYQDLTLEGISITVYATQLASEFDSYGNTYDKNIDTIKGARIHYSSDRYQIAADLSNLRSAENLAVRILDQNGNVITTITPEKELIPVNGKLTVCAAITGDSSSWQHTPFIPSLNVIPTVMELVINGEVVDADVIGSKPNNNLQNVEWSEVVMAVVPPVDTADKLTDAIANGATAITLTEDMTIGANNLKDAESDLTVVLASNTNVTVNSGAAANKNVTFTGDKNSKVVLVNTNPGYEGALAYHDNANLTFKGITFDANQISGMCARGGVVTFIDCKITGELEKTIASKFVFSGCTFDVGVTQVGYGCSDVVFKDCKFETDGYGIKIYNETQNAHIDLTVENCSFKNTGDSEKSAIFLDHIISGITYNITVDNCTFDGFTAVPTPNENIWAARMIVTDSFVKTADGQYIFSYQTGAEGGNYHKILTADQLVVTVN